MKLALLSNVTIEVLAGMLKREHELWLPSGYGAWMEIALNPPAELREFDPEVFYLILDGHFEQIIGDADVARQALARAFPSAAVCVLDVAHFADDFGAEFYDERMWKLGKMPWSMLGLRELKKVFSFKKVLALDLDNTLWDGIVGEDGREGITLRSNMLAEIAALKQRGILLTIISKNNPEDVKWFFEKDDPFVVKSINWKVKGENLTQQAQMLNLGTDAFVFVDDNPAERAEMRSLHPEVLVADFPPQLSAFFPKRIVSAEDEDKTDQYQAEFMRKEFAMGLSLEEYLKGLEIRTYIHPITDDEILRVAQLSQKTNQFNVCTNRYSEADIRHFAADSECLLMTLHASDRFGDQGLVAFVLCRIAGARAEIVDWVMSCRAMNRKIEFSMQAAVEANLKSRGVKELTATWVRTNKNAPVKDLFERFGFDIISISDEKKLYKRVWE